MSEDTSLPIIVGPYMDGTLCVDCPLNFWAVSISVNILVFRISREIFETS